MKSKHILFSLLLLSILSRSNADPINFNNYSSIKCSGPVPEVIKKYLALAPVEKMHGNSRETDLHLKMSNLFKNGQIIYGDELNEYINKVADNALKGDPELRKQLTFFIAKSSSVNAFETGTGIIFINIGLLCHIQNEAQLALIICHEASHFKLNHYEKSAIRREVLSKGKTAVNGDSRTKLLVSQSKTFEIEADEMGFDLFLKSTYTSKDVEKTFEVLKYSHLPYENPAFTSDYFDDKDYNLPTRYFLSKSKIRQAKKSNYTHLNVHPDIDSRQENILKYILKNGQREGISYYESQEKFEYIRKKSRHELSLIFIQEGNYPASFYNTYILERNYGQSPYFDQLKAHCLYAMCAIKNQEYSEEYYLDMRLPDSLAYCYNWKIISGNSQNLYYFINKIPARELNVLALKEIEKYYSKNKTEFLKTRREELCQWLVGLHKLKINDFNFNLELDQMDSLEKARRSEKIAKGLNYFNFAFNNEVMNPDFVALFNRSELLIAKRANSVNRNYLIEVDKIENRYGVALGIKNISIVELEFKAIDYNYANFDSVYYVVPIRNPKYSREDELRIGNNYESLLLKYARNIGINLKIKDSMNVAELTTEQYNDFQNLKNWTEEVLVSKGLFKTYNDIDKDNLNDTAHIGIVQLYLVEDEMHILFYVINVADRSIEYCYRTSLENVGPENVKTRASLYEILDHIRQKPVKIEKLKKEYGIEN